MGFSQANGYVPVSIETMMESVRTNFNAQFGTTYTTENFLGTGAYKYFYALIQRLQENEIRTSEIFLKVQQYFEVINARISRPSVTSPGIIEKMELNGYVASVKPMIDADAGKISICVDVDDTDPDYDDIKLSVCTLISQSVAGGIVSQGTESESITLSNGQAFDFKYILPNRIEPLIRLTLTLSDNNMAAIGTPDTTKQLLVDNIESKYRLGRDFEPQRYFTTADAPWTSQVLLEYSLDNGSTWLDEVYDANFDDLFEILLENITLVEV